MGFRRADNDNNIKRPGESLTPDAAEGQVMNTSSLKKCPMCKKESVQKYRPFCSKRCADLDLGRWLDGQYAIAGHADTEEDGALPTHEQSMDKKIEENE